MPSAYTMWLVALDFRLGPSQEVVIATSNAPGAEAGPEEFLSAMRKRFLPRVVVLLKHEGLPGERLIGLAPYAAAHVPIDGRAAAYACTGFVCQAPVLEPAELMQALAPGQ